MSHVLGMEEKCCEPHLLPSFPTLVPCRTAGLALPAQPHTSTMGPAQGSLREGSAHHTASPRRLTPQQEPELSSLCCQFVFFSCQITNHWQSHRKADAGSNLWRPPAPAPAQSCGV